MDMNWDDIRYFLTVSRTNSFAGAASRLLVTHSTVSRRITALESSLSTTLFLRTEKGCRLTPAGEALLPHAEKLEATMIELEESAHNKDSQLSGSVRIGAPDGLGNCFLATHITEFLKIHPQLEIELIAVPMYYSLAKREVDILITLTKPTAGNVISRKILDYNFGLFASKEYIKNHGEIKSEDDLIHHNKVDYIQDLVYDKNFNLLIEFAPGQNTRFRSSTIISQMFAISSGACVGVLPYFMARTNPELVQILPELSAERSFWLQVAPDSRHIARIRATIDYIISQMEANSELFLSM